MKIILIAAIAVLQLATVLYYKRIDEIKTRKFRLLDGLLTALVIILVIRLDGIREQIAVMAGYLVLRFWRKSIKKTARERGDFYELCLDRDSDASSASHSDDLEDVGKQLERCAGKGRSGANHRVVALHCCVPDR